MKMDNVTILLMQILLSCVVYTIVAVWYVWPSLTKLSRNAALIPLLFVHVMRYLGLATLVTGMIDPKLPRDFLSNAAYGDIIAAALAIACIFALRSNSRVAVPLVWVFSTFGLVDMLNGLNSTFQWDVASFDLGTFWYIYRFLAPQDIVSSDTAYPCPNCVSTHV